MAKKRVKVKRRNPVAKNMPRTGAGFHVPKSGIKESRRTLKQKVAKQVKDEQ